MNTSALPTRIDLLAKTIGWSCRSTQQARSKGVFYGENPLMFPTSAFFAQASSCALCSALLQCLLSPLGQSAFFSMMLVGIAIGPPFWGYRHEWNASSEYALKCFYVNQTIAGFGCVIFMFLVGAKTDLAMVRRSGKKAVAFGLITFAVPLIVTTIVATVLRRTLIMRPELYDAMYYIAAFQSVSSFHVIVCLLNDLNLLNSRLGRLATSSAMISNVCSWICLGLIFAIKQNSVQSTGSRVAKFMMTVWLLIMIKFIMKPIMVRMIKLTPEGKPICEGYVMDIFLMLLVCSLYTEFVGQHASFGAVILGLAVPDGPPLGSTIVNKLDTIVTSMLLPGFFVYSVSGINVLSIQQSAFIAIGVLALSSFVAKVVGVMVPSIMFLNMSPANALSFGLIMSSQGIADVIILQQGFLLMIIDEQMYSMIMVCIIVISGVTAPMIKSLYKPTKYYRSTKKGTLQYSNPNMEIKMLACLCHQEQTPSLMGLLDLYNPNIHSPICCYIIHMVELTGRLSPLFIHHKMGRRRSLHTYFSSHIINAFRYYERQRNGAFVANLFTSISPFATMHQEICRVAAQKGVSVMIVPFHVQWRRHGTEDFQKVRQVNLQLLSSAPCSVGILVDRGTIGGSLLGDNNEYKIAIIFVQGKDDREALACALRMSAHPNIAITMIRMIESNPNTTNFADLEQDNDMITEFKITAAGKKHHSYNEEVVKDGVEMFSVIKSMELPYDLILLGRNADSRSPLLIGLGDWSEFPELGVIGETLIAEGSTYEGSILVVQQQGSGVDQRNETNVVYFSEHSNSTASRNTDYMAKGVDACPFVQQKVCYI